MPTFAQAPSIQPRDSLGVCLPSLPRYHLSLSLSISRKAVAQCNLRRMSKTKRTAHVSSFLCAFPVHRPMARHLIHAPFTHVAPLPLPSFILAVSETFCFRALVCSLHRPLRPLFTLSFLFVCCSGLLCKRFLTSSVSPLPSPAELAPSHPYGVRGWVGEEGLCVCACVCHTCCGV